MDNDLITLCFNLGLLLDNDITEKLLFKTFECDSEVDQCDLDTDFWRVMGIGQLGCHEESEVIVVVLGCLTKLDLLDSTFTHKFGVHQDWVKTGVDIFLHIFDQDGVTIVDCGRNFSQESVRSELKQTHVGLLVHILNPLVGLLLRVNTKTPSLGACRQDTIFCGGLISGKTIDAPATNSDSVTHNLDQTESLRARNLLFLADCVPTVRQPLPVSTSECTEVGNTSAGEEDITDELINVNIETLDSFLPSYSFFNKQDNKLLSTTHACLITIHSEFQFVLFGLKSVGVSNESSYVLLNNAELIKLLVEDCHALL